MPLIDNMGILFAIGVGVGMSDDNDGTAGLAGLASWLVNWQPYKYRCSCNV